MSSPRTPPETDREVASTHEGNWWHRSHPTFAGIVGFFSGMVLVTAIPGAFAAILRLLFSDDMAEELFPFVLLLLAVPIFMLAKQKTRRFGIFMVIGMVLTTVVVVSVTSLVLFFML